MSIVRSALLSVAAAMGLLCLSSCDVDLFGFDSKRIAAGYRLLQTEAIDGCILMPPHGNIGSSVVELGWRKPFILSRAGQDDHWQVIDTSTKQTLSISEEQRHTDPRYRDIPVYAAHVAWDRLKHWRRQW